MKLRSPCVVEYGAASPSYSADRCAATLGERSKVITIACDEKTALLKGSAMRRFETRTDVIKFAIGSRTHTWLTNVVQEFSQITVDGMSFAQSLLLWSVALTSSIPVAVGHGSTSVQIMPKQTKAHGDEQIITVHRDLLQPMIDMLAILIDGDRKEVQHLDRTPAVVLHHHLCTWYSLEAQLRSDMRRAYQTRGAEAPATQVLTDEALITYIQDHPGTSLRRLCAAFDIQWCLRPDEQPGYGYTPQAQGLRRQLQRLRRTGRLGVDSGQQWYSIQSPGQPLPR